MVTFEEHLDQNFEAEYKAACERSAHRLATEPHIIKAHYDAKLRLIIVQLSKGGWFSFHPEDAQGLGEGTTEQLKQIEISPSQFGLHFPLLDAQFDITGLLQGRFGSKKWMASRANGKLAEGHRKQAS